MIVTVTLNPALDLTYTVDALIPHGTHRVAAVAERPGGKGLNVAAVLHALGEPVLATGLLGGTTGGRVTALLQENGIPSAFTRIAGETRRTVAVADPVDATGFWEPGPRITEGEWAAFVSHFRGLLGRASVVALSGSLPPGIPADGYGVLIRLASVAGVRTVLDTSGEALRHGLAAGPDLAKPNALELAALLTDTHQPAGATPGGSDSPALLTDTHHPAGATPGGSDSPALLTDTHHPDLADAGRALAMGARAVVVSRGPRGLLALTGEGGWRGVPSEQLVGNPTGAGDACVAALSRGLRDKTPWPDLLADAVALSAAAVASPIAGAVDQDTYRRLRPTVRVEPA
jgi:tagatose 6-phosphate kinase